mmetsp:Transcript_15937/g.43228  ORF Transcript_15937/g.43228 Transcript_15937/m.43228 type:complete len:268 (+) Transcript_15937:565-1368(+)
MWCRLMRRCSSVSSMTASSLYTCLSLSDCGVLAMISSKVTLASCTITSLCPASSTVSTSVVIPGAAAKVCASRSSRKHAGPSSMRSACSSSSAFSAAAPALCELVATGDGSTSGRSVRADAIKSESSVRTGPLHLTSAWAICERDTSWKSLIRCHSTTAAELTRSKTATRKSLGHCSRSSSRGRPPCITAASRTSTRGRLLASAARTSRRQLRERKYPSVINTSRAPQRPTISSSAPIPPASSRSSTSRKSRAPGSTATSISRSTRD